MAQGRVMQLVKRDNRVRTWIRNLRFFFKPDNRNLYAECIQDAKHIFFLPVVRERDIVWKSGKRLRIHRRSWFMLPTLCRVHKLGADIRWRENDLEVSFDGMIFVSPPDNRLLPLELDGILAKDHWRIREAPVSGKMVVDIGAHIGVFAVACAKKGALVHAFEPFAGFRKYIDLNKKLNGVEGKIVIHPVGLSNRDEGICSSRALEAMASYTHGKGPIALERRVEVVDAISYFQKNAIANVEMIKVNCEGCEYDLISPQFLKFVKPNRLSLEFHDGIAQLAEVLTFSGMSVEGDLTKHQGKGNLFARKTKVH